MPNRIELRTDFPEKSLVSLSPQEGVDTRFAKNKPVFFPTDAPS
jgi:hypothetical protein